MTKMSSFKCRQCNCMTFGEPAQRDRKTGKPICKYCLEKLSSKNE